MWNLILILLTGLSLPALLSPVIYRLTVRRATGDFGRDARMRLRWLSLTQIASLGVWVVLLSEARQLVEGNGSIPRPILALGLAGAYSLTSALTALSSLRLDTRLRALPGKLLENVRPLLFFHWLLYGNVILGCIFLPLGIFDCPAGILEIHWPVLGGYAAVQVFFLIGGERLLNVLFRLETLPDERIQRVMSRHAGGFRSFGVVETFGSRFANAFAFPLKRRILVTRALIEALDEDELDAIICHELGHFQSGLEGLLRLGLSCLAPLAFCLLNTLLECWNPVQPIYLLMALLGILLAVFALHRLKPGTFQNWEERADRYALEHCRDPEAFAGALVKIHRLDWLPEEFQPRGKETTTHPSLKKRLEMVRAFKKSQLM